MNAEESTPKATKVRPKYVNAPVAVQRGERIPSSSETGKAIAKAMVKTGIVAKDFRPFSMGLNRATFTMDGDEIVEGYVAYPHCSQFAMYLSNRYTCLGIDTGRGTVGPRALETVKEVGAKLAKGLPYAVARDVGNVLYAKAESYTAQSAAVFRLLDAVIRHNTSV